MEDDGANLHELLQELEKGILAGDEGKLTSSEREQVQERILAVLPRLVHEYLNVSKHAEQKRSAGREALAVLKLITCTVSSLPGAFSSDESLLLTLIAHVLGLSSLHSFRRLTSILCHTLFSLLHYLYKANHQLYTCWISEAFTCLEDVASLSASAQDKDEACLVAFEEFFRNALVEFCKQGPQSPDSSKKSKTCTFLSASCIPPGGNGILLEVGSEKWQAAAEVVLSVLTKALSLDKRSICTCISTELVAALGHFVCHGCLRLRQATFGFLQEVWTELSEVVAPVEEVTLSILQLLSCGVEAAEDDSSKESFHLCLSKCLHTVVAHAGSSWRIRCLHDTVIQVLSGVLSQALNKNVKEILFLTVFNVISVVPNPSLHVLKILAGLGDAVLRQASVECLRRIASADGVHKCVSADSAALAQDQGRLSKRRRLGQTDSLPGSTIEGCGVAEEEWHLSMHPLWSALFSSLDQLSCNRFVSENCDLSLHREPRACLNALAVLAQVVAPYPRCKEWLAVAKQISGWVAWAHKQDSQSSIGDKEILACLAALSSLLTWDEKGGAISILGSNEGKGLLSSWDRSALIWLTSAATLQKAVPSSDRSSAEVHAVRVSCALQAFFPDDSVPRILRALEHGSTDLQLHALGLLSPLISGSSVWDSDMTVRLTSILRGLLLSKESQAVVNRLAAMTGGVVCGLYWRAQPMEGKDLPKGCASCSRNKLDALALPDDTKVVVLNDFLFSLTPLLQQVLGMSLERAGDSGLALSIIESLPGLFLHGSQQLLSDIKPQVLQLLDSMLVHPNRSVRTSFASALIWFLLPQPLGMLFSSDGEKTGGNASPSLSLLARLKRLLARKNLASETKETLIGGVGELMVAAGEDVQLLLFSLVLLIEQLDSSNLALRAWAVSVINQSLRRLCPGLLDQYSRVITVVDPVKEEFFEYLSGRLTTRPILVDEFAALVAGLGRAELVRRSLPFVLPIVSVQAAGINKSSTFKDKALKTLNEIALTLNLEVPVFLVTWCPKILAGALLKSDATELFRLLTFLEAQIGTDAKELLERVLPSLLDELVLLLGSKSSQAADVPSKIQEVALILRGSKDLPEFLRSHLVRILNDLDYNGLRSRIKDDQQRALRILGQLIPIIGSNLATFAPKFLALLSYSLEIPELQNQALLAWSSFIRELASAAPKVLSSTATLIVASLVPLFDQSECLAASEDSASVSVVDLLELLFVTNFELVKDSLDEMPLLPSLDSLHAINRLIEEAQEKSGLECQLSSLAAALGHESMKVRQSTAVRLKRLLATRRDEVSEVQNSELAADKEMIHLLVGALLKGTVEELKTKDGQNLRLLCAESLGLLGAMDPFRLQLEVHKKLDEGWADEDLVRELISTHLARILRGAAQASIQDSAAVTIQELLKLCGCMEDLVGSGHGSSELTGDKQGRPKSTPLGKKLWESFPHDVKNVISPCLSSRLILKVQKGQKDKEQGPVYQKGISVRRWVSAWLHRIIVKGKSLRSQVFDRCRAVLKDDVATCMYVLPKVVLDVLCEGTEQARADILSEILAVLQDGRSEAESSSRPDASSSRTQDLNGNVCQQAVFSLIDQLVLWSNEASQAKSQIHQTLSSGKSSGLEQEGSRILAWMGRGLTVTKPIGKSLDCYLSRVEALLHAIPKETLAQTALQCQAFARSFQYYEMVVREKTGCLNPSSGIPPSVFHDDDVSCLLRTYRELEEPDGLLGLTKLRRCSTFSDHILTCETSGNWTEALAYYEQALQADRHSVANNEGMLNCQLNMGNLQAMITQVNGLRAEEQSSQSLWSLMGAQAAWRLGQWDSLKDFVGDLEGSSTKIEGAASVSSGALDFNLSLGKLLLHLNDSDAGKFSSELKRSRASQLSSLGAAAMESYSRAYPALLRLHILQDVEDYAAHNSANSSEEFTFESWERRLLLTQPTVWVREPLLSVGRVIFGALDDQRSLGRCWIEYARLCRKAGHHQTASRAVLEAQALQAPGAVVESAKVLASMGSMQRAIWKLQDFLRPHHECLGAAAGIALGSLFRTNTGQAFSDVRTQSVLSTSILESQVEVGVHDGNDIISRSLLLLARWMHESGQLQKVEILQLYNQVKVLQPRWQKAYFFLAKYYDDILQDAQQRQDQNEKPASSSIQAKHKASGSQAADSPWWTYICDTMSNYAKSLRWGHKYLFDALPRLLTLWFDFGARFHGDALKQSLELRDNSMRVFRIMEECQKSLPTYQWLVALPQLVSRICHQNGDVLRILRAIIINVLLAYPQQALWMLAAVSKSVVTARSRAANDIISAAKTSVQGSERQLFSQFAAFVEQMIRLCFHAPANQQKVKTLNIAAEFASLKRMMPVDVAMPVQHVLTASMPASGVAQPGYNPFPSNEIVTIVGIADEADVLQSLQRPKKVTLFGSDGREYPFLCKPKDDLRKDARMMEFTGMLNRLFSKDAPSRRRKLLIRTFAVLPLTEDCGMVEWVPNTRGFRQIMQELYSSAGRFDQRTLMTVKKTYEKCQSQGMPEDEMLQKHVLPMFPPLFHKWFLLTFSEPTKWFQTRLLFSRTAAVWSMVGHIVGLGDRHGENLLLDAKTGQCVHVDFSCLFDKGLALQQPEVVPFRLTQNMVDGLGISGYEGVFLNVCAIVLSVLRSQRGTLMSVLETFLHDPLVEWTKSHKSSGSEMQNPAAQRALKNIRDRLQGVVVGVQGAPSLPLSVEGQAYQLALEAVSLRNLGKMYIWWMPWF